MLVLLRISWLIRRVTITITITITITGSKMIGVKCGTFSKVISRSRARVAGVIVIAIFSRGIFAGINIFMAGQEFNKLFYLVERGGGIIGGNVFIHFSSIFIYKVGAKQINVFQFVTMHDRCERFNWDFTRDGLGIHRVEVVANYLNYIVVALFDPEAFTSFKMFFLRVEILSTNTFSLNVLADKVNVYSISKHSGVNRVGDWSLIRRSINAQPFERVIFD